MNVRSQRTLAALLNDILETYGPKVAAAFREAIDDLKSQAKLQIIVKALERGDVEAAMQALNIDEAAFGPLDKAIGEPFETAGQVTSTSLKAPSNMALAIRWNGRNLRAEQILREQSSRLIAGIVSELRQVAREVMAQGLAKGQNPRATALDIIGRKNRVTGRREGGILGLSRPQETAAQHALEELTSDNPEGLRNYLGRKLRDRRFDRSIAKAIREKRAPDSVTATKALTAYRNRLLRHRGEVIGRTETLTALNAASHEALRQAVEAGGVQAENVRRTWRSAGDFRVRHTHAGLNGDTVGLDEAFVSPGGARLRFPGDTSLGAPASEIIGCRCIVSSRITWLPNQR